MLGFCCPGTLLLSAKYNLFCSRRCLKIGNMPSSERFFRQTKPIWRRNTWCIPRKIGNVWRKKSRRLGMLTIFKRALSQVKTWLRVFLWREGLTLTDAFTSGPKATPGYCPPLPGRGAPVRVFTRGSALGVISNRSVRPHPRASHIRSRWSRLILVAISL